MAIVHEELSYADPALCLSYLAHSVLLCNNLAVNGSHEQVSLAGLCCKEVAFGYYTLTECCVPFSCLDSCLVYVMEGKHIRSTQFHSIQMN